MPLSQILSSISIFMLDHEPQPVYLQTTDSTLVSPQSIGGLPRERGSVVGLASTAGWVAATAQCG